MEHAIIIVIIDRNTVNRRVCHTSQKMNIHQWTNEANNFVWNRIRIRGNFVWRGRFVVLVCGSGICWHLTQISHVQIRTNVEYLKSIRSHSSWTRRCINCQWKSIDFSENSKSHSKTFDILFIEYLMPASHVMGDVLFVWLHTLHIHAQWLSHTQRLLPVKYVNRNHFIIYSPTVSFLKNQQRQWWGCDCFSLMLHQLLFCSSLIMFLSVNDSLSASTLLRVEHVTESKLQWTSRTQFDNATNESNRFWALEFYLIGCLLHSSARKYENIEFRYDPFDSIASQWNGMGRHSHTHKMT